MSKELPPQLINETVVVVSTCVVCCCSIALCTAINMYAKRAQAPMTQSRYTRGELDIYNGLFHDPHTEKLFLQWQMKKYLKLSFKIFAAFYIFYPLLAEYTVYPPDDDAAFSRIRAGPEASSSVVFIKLFQRFGLGIGCALAGWSNTYKTLLPTNWYEWVQEFLLPSWIYVFYHFIAISYELQSLICTLERSGYVNAQHVKCASISVGFHHSGDIRTFRLDPEIHLKIENANYMRWTNMTYQDTADYNAFMNKAILPWSYGWMILFENYQTYLYFLVLPYLGLATFDLNLRCCCGRKRRLGYRFSLIMLLLHSILQGTQVRKVRILYHEHTILCRH